MGLIGKSKGQSKVSLTILQPVSPAILQKGKNAFGVSRTILERKAANSTESLASIALNPFLPLMRLEYHERYYSIDFHGVRGFGKMHLNEAVIQLKRGKGPSRGKLAFHTHKIGNASSKNHLGAARPVENSIRPMLGTPNFLRLKVSDIPWKPRERRP
jgi:hypothetical protein